MEAAAALGAATVKVSASTPTEGTALGEIQAREIADVVTQSIQPKALRRLSEATVLWVDDNPENNVYERRALEALGIRFAISLDTADALEKLSSHKYDAIISDMGRGQDRSAGYTLLAEKEKLGDRTPLIFYTRDTTPKYKQEARQRGALGQTNSPQELFSLVLDAIQRGE